MSAQGDGRFDRSYLFGATAVQYVTWRDPAAGEEFLDTRDEKGALFRHACHRHAERRRLDPLGHLREAAGERDTGAGAPHRPLVAEELGGRRDAAPRQPIQGLNPHHPLDEAGAEESRATIYLFKVQIHGGIGRYVSFAHFA